MNSLGACTLYSLFEIDNDTCDRESLFSRPKILITLGKSERSGTSPQDSRCLLSLSTLCQTVPRCVELSL